MLQISSLKYAPVTSRDVEESFAMFKNVQSGKHMSLNEDNLEKLVVHCFIKNENNIDLNFNIAYLYYFSVSLCIFGHMIVHECMHVLRFDSAWKSGLYLRYNILEFYIG